MKSQIPLVGSVLHRTDFSDASNQAFAQALAISVIRQTKQPAFSDFRRVERERLQICGARLKPCSSYEGVPRTLAARSHRALHGRVKKPPQLAASLGLPRQSPKAPARYLFALRQRQASALCHRFAKERLESMYDRVRANAQWSTETRL